MYVWVCTLVLGLVQPVDNDVALRDAKGVEVLADGQSQLVLVHAALGLGAGHGGREAADAVAEDDVAEGVGEGRGRVEAVGAAVTLQDGGILRGPLHLRQGCVSMVVVVLGEDRGVVTDVRRAGVGGCVAAVGRGIVDVLEGAAGGGLGAGALRAAATRSGV